MEIEYLDKLLDNENFLEVDKLIIEFINETIECWHCSNDSLTNIVASHEALKKCVEILTFTQTSKDKLENRDMLIAHSHLLANKIPLSDMQIEAILRGF